MDHITESAVPRGVYLPGPGGGVSGPGGVSGTGGCLVPGEYLPGGGVPAWSWGVPGQVLPPCGQNDTRL